jgi:hypothetical protein
LKDSVNLVLKLDRRERLHDIIIHPGCDRSDHMFFGVFSCHHEERNALIDRMAPHITEKIKTVQRLHVQVGEDQVDLFGLKKLFGFFHIRSDPNDRETCGLEEVADIDTHRIDVVHHKDVHIRK